MSSPARSATGPAVSRDQRRRSFARARSTKSRRCCACAATPARAVVPQGGNTGLVGGSVPLHGEIVLDLRRLDALGPGRRARRTGHRAGGSDARATSHEHAAQRGLGLRRRPLGPRHARPSAARSRPTPAGCTCCATARPAGRCSASRRCSPTGAIMRRLDGLEKDNTGYDLSGLLCGSEGTLAVITAGPAPAGAPARRTWWSRCSRSTRSTPRSTRSASCAGALDSLRAVELFFAGRTRPRVRAARARPPVPGPSRRVRAGRGGRADRPDGRPRRRRSTRSPDVADVAVASRRPHAPATSGATGRATPKRSTSSARRTSSTSRSPPTSSPDSCPDVRDAGDRRRARRVGLAVRTRSRRECSRKRHRRRARRRSRHRRGAPTRRATARFDQRRTRHRNRKTGMAARSCAHPTEIDAFRAIKRALDPNGVLNPNVLLPPETRRLIGSPTVQLDTATNPARLWTLLPHRPAAPCAGVVGSGRRLVGPPAAVRRPEHFHRLLRTRTNRRRSRSL